MNSKPRFVGERIPLRELCSKGKSSLRLKDLPEEGTYEVYGASGIVGSMDDYQIDIPYVALVKDGAGVGRAMSCEAKTSVLGTMQALLPNEGVGRDYLLHLVRSMKLGEGSSGSTIPHIYFKDYGKRLVPNYGIEEQALISENLTRVEQLQALLESQIELLDQLVKSRFVEMFGFTSESSRWDSLTIGELATDIRYGTSKKASDEGEFVYLRMNNMTDDGHLDFKDTKAITLEGDELEKCLVRKGDLLFNRTNSRERVGKTAVFDGDEPMVIAGYIIRVRFGGLVRSGYVSTFMNLATTKKRLRSIAKGAVHQANINSKELASLSLPVPPIELQDRFLFFVAQVDKSRFAAQQQVEKLQMLYDSLAQDYFG